MIFQRKSLALISFLAVIILSWGLVPAHAYGIETGTAADLSPTVSVLENGSLSSLYDASDLPNGLPKQNAILPAGASRPVCGYASADSYSWAVVSNSVESRSVTMELTQNVLPGYAPGPLLQACLLSDIPPPQA